MKTALVWKLLRRHLSAWQIMGFFFANLLGMCIVLGGLQFYRDVLPIFTSTESFMQPQHLVVAKKVTSLRTLSGNAPSFSKSELRDFEEQPFVRSIGRFTPAQFDVSASLGSKEMGMYFSTEMFFEAIPDNYIDADLSEWHFEPGESTAIPIILPRNYLNLYNFGFAGSRGLPAISEGVVGMVDIRFRLRGTHNTWNLTGRVVDFSNRLNTILVPQSFMDYANESLSPEATPEYSRVIVELSNPTDERVTPYLEENGYEAESGADDMGKMAFFLNLVIGVVMAVGLVICALSFYVLLLSIFLLLQKHTDRIDNLLLIGYRPSQVALPFHLLSCVLNASVLCLSLGFVCLLRAYYLPLLGVVYPQLEEGSLVMAAVVGGGLFVFVELLDFVAIHRKISNIWSMHRS